MEHWAFILEKTKGVYEEEKMLFSLPVTQMLVFGLDIVWTLYEVK